MMMLTDLSATPSGHSADLLEMREIHLLLMILLTIHILYGQNWTQHLRTAERQSVSHPG